MTPNHEIKVIARFLDGSLVKGTTLDFFPTKDRFHITEESGNVLDVHVGALKAVFFVRDFEGDPEYTDKKGFLAPPQGKKVMVEFVDGEVMFGYTLSYSARGLGFFMFPGDPESNNTKVFIVNKATRRVKIKTLDTPLGARPFAT
jgi:hypothetical protein